MGSAVIISLVLEIRQKLPMVGTKKLYRMLKDDIGSMGLKLGRDRFIEILRENSLLIRKKRQYTRTTNSSHHFRVYKNLIKDKEAAKPDEVYVSDITYIRVGEGFNYLSLISDLYSRKIVGYDLSNSLSIEGSLRALKMAVGKRETLEGLIHHSDRGIQYCSKNYVELLRKHQISISMSEKGNPYENAVAERLNGILKEEFLLNSIFKTQLSADKAVKEAVKNYNHLRPHMSIDYMTPSQRYVQRYAA